MEAHYIFHPSTIWVRPLFTELGPKKNPKSRFCHEANAYICRLSGDIINFKTVDRWVTWSQMSMRIKSNHDPLRIDKVLRFRKSDNSNKNKKSKNNVCSDWDPIPGPEITRKSPVGFSADSFHCAGQRTHRPFPENLYLQCLEVGWKNYEPLNQWRSNDIISKQNKSLFMFYRTK